MELDSYKSPVWQLGAKSKQAAEGEVFHYSTRYHCFVGDKALCNDYKQNTQEHGAVIGKVERLAKLPDLLACKKCWRAWQKKYAEQYQKNI